MEFVTSASVSTGPEGTTTSMNTHMSRFTRIVLWFISLNALAGALSLILTAEAAAAFDDLTRSGRDQEMVKQDENAWPNTFRLAQMLPAVEYVRANRIRTLLQRQWNEVFADLDVLVVPTYGGDVLLATNLTGHPCVVVPDGFLSRDGTPVSLSFLGRLDGEPELLLVADAWQRATDFHRKRPPLAATGASR